ncbi:hypothetical protein CC1G_06580 [Coprinopsis cinerea okayama7|uniref:Uncharacterized protein n=1 Tax=Coprinopsis cinerea (strain Okayama-7 / 130 / ATCC MYA-4618 / FGSC 9003) TaxID=240176 RepID=A8N308_COPC7|nr:hypothetical protein CC1G_06580 [Coprinopsis cinerea okayama7\|eukprot:XP_001829243.1 hypothetical protein CC1G_06580 [Coprinopsis cinerea okayama7\
MSYYYYFCMDSDDEESESMDYGSQDYVDEDERTETESTDVSMVDETASMTRSISGSSRYTRSDDTSDMSSVVSGPTRFSGSSVSSATSFTHNPSSVASEDSEPEVIEITHEMHAAMYKHEFGRSLNNYSDVYRLPVDEEELGRLSKQHYMLERIMGKYPPPLPYILQSNTPGEKAVLDLGCGNGDWIISVARDFPNCDAVAVDLVPIGDASDLPPNIRCEIDDINLGLSHFYGQFDVVHCRLIAPGISDYYRLIEDVARVVRPGGLVEFGESDCYVYDGNKQRVHAPMGELAAPWWPRWMSYLRAAIRQGGGNTEVAGDLRDWIRDHGAFHTIHYQNIWLPLIPAPDDDHDDPIFSVMKDDVLTFIRSGRPLLLGRGFPEDVVITLEENAVRELNESDEPCFSRFQRVWAIRNDVDIGPMPG